MKPAERRREAHRLRAEGLSIREIARRLHVSPSTVHGYLAADPPPKGKVPANAAGPGNQRARKHGAFSLRNLAPLREAAVEYLRERYPWLPDVRLGVAADRIAIYQSTTGALADFDPLRFRGGDVDLQPLAEKASKAAAALEKLFRELDEEAKAQPIRSGDKPGFADVPLRRLTLPELMELEQLTEAGYAAHHPDVVALAQRVRDRIATDPARGEEGAPRWGDPSDARARADAHEWLAWRSRRWREADSAAPEPADPDPQRPQLPPAPVDPFEAHG